MSKKTVVIGATPNPTRYAYSAVSSLLGFGHEPIPIGIKKGTVQGIEIINSQPDLEGVDTVTLYLSPQRQEPYYQYILSLSPKRIIFNPGTENPELMKLAEANGIEVVVGCTLVMLAVGNY